jgi:hypothetical protein
VTERTGRSTASGAGSGIRAKVVMSETVTAGTATS